MSTTLNDQLYRLLERHSLDTLFPWYAWDEELKLVFMAHGYIGCVMACNLFSGMDDSITEELESAWAMNLPPDTFVQIIQMNVPDVQQQLLTFQGARSGIAEDCGLTGDQRKLLAAITDQAAAYYGTYHAAEAPVFRDSGVPLTESQVFIAIKMPVAEFPTDEEVQNVHERITSFQSSLNSFHPVRLSRGQTLALWRRFVHIRSDWFEGVDDYQLLRDQILGPGDAVDDRSDLFSIQHGDGKSDVIKVLSVKGFTRPVNAASTNFLMGDPLGKGGQMLTPAAVILTVRLPDQVKKRNELNSKQVITNMQARGRMAKWSPRLGMRKEGIDFLIHALDSGDHAVEMNVTGIIWGKTKEEADKAAKGFISQGAKAGFTFLEDNFLALPMFLNALPLYPDEQSLFMTKRMLSGTTSQAAVCAPLLVDWTGNVQGVQRMTIPGAGTIFVTRRGHLLLFDLYASESGYNFVLAGRTRSGKSVTAQQLLQDQLTLGAQVWVIEIGRSFEKLCTVFKGDHIDLRPDMDIGLNPFSVVENLHDEMDELVGIFGTMISPKGELSDRDLNIIELAIESIFGNMGQDATPTHMAEYLVAQDNDPRAIEMGKMLHRFTDHGAYGHWFNQPMNVDLRGRFVNLELKELENRHHLLMVVLMQMMFAIGREIGRGDGGTGGVRRRVLFVDEASVLLQIPTAAKFLEGLSRRVAKNRGSLGLGLQGLRDLYMNEYTRVIASQTAHFLVMKQHRDVLDQLENDRLFSVGGAAYEMMRSLRKTGEYAECFIMSEDQMGIGRLKLDPYRRVLFATDGPEKEEVIAAMRSGVAPDQAIRDFLGRQKAYIATRELAEEEHDPEDADDRNLDYLKSISEVEDQMQKEQQAAELAEKQAEKRDTSGRARRKWKIF